MSSALPVELYVLAVVADIILLLWCRMIWKQAHTVQPNLRIQFGIVDLWFAILGLSPTLWIATLFPREQLIPFLLLMIPHQIAGVFIFRLDAPRFRVQNNEPAWKVAIMTVSGVLLGWIVPVLTLVLSAALFFALMLFLVFLPLTLPVMLGVWIWRQNKTQQNKLPQSSPLQDGNRL